MSKKILLITVSTAIAILTGCFKEENYPISPTQPDPVQPDPVQPDVSYSIDTAVVDYNGANNVVFYHFATGNKVVRSHTVWHIGFDKNLNVVANSGDYGSGVSVHKTALTDFDHDFSDIIADTATKFVSTYSQNNPLGNSWMDLSSMPPTFTNIVYLVKIHNNVIYKVQFTGGGMGGTVKMKIDAPAAAGVIEQTFGPVGNFDMIYINLASRTAVDFAPSSDAWDVRFGRTEFIMGTSTGGRSSIVINSGNGAQAAVDSVNNIEGVTGISGYTFSPEPFTIGHSWYATEGMPPTFIVPQKTFMIKTVEGKYAKFQIATFYGPGEPRQQFWTVFEYLYQADGALTFSR